MVPGIDYQKCTRNFRKGKCANGHIMAKQIVCGYDYCRECGKMESIAHNRRIARWWPKIFSYKKVGYYVITVPKEIRDVFKDRIILSEFKKFAIRLLKNTGHVNGMLRYHWFGDCKECKGSDSGCIFCKFTGAGNEWHPHLNIFTEGKYIKPEDFKLFTQKLKDECQYFFESVSGTDLTGKVNIWYSYKDDPALICHVLKYVTRATFRIYNKDLADLLKGFRSNQTWGKFGKCLHETKNNPTIALMNNLCPCCKTTILWEKELIKRDTFKKMNVNNIGDGFYQIIPLKI